MNWIFWLVLVIILAIIEVLTVNLLTIWFVVSGIVVMILSFFIDDVAILSTIFALLGIFLLFISRPIVNKIRSKNANTTNLERIIGKKAIVTEKITKNNVGEVKIEGKKWSAVCMDTCEVNSEVIVDAIDGVKLIVRRED